MKADFLSSRCDNIESVDFTINWSPEELFNIVLLCGFQLNRINDYESQIRKLKSQLAKEQKGESTNK